MLTRAPLCFTFTAMSNTESSMQAVITNQKLHAYVHVSTLHTVSINHATGRLVKMINRNILELTEFKNTEK